MASSESVEASNDLISNMPAIVTDKIFKHLPILIAAKTSVLSRTWRRKWLSCPYLMFDDAFWEGVCKWDENHVIYDWQKASSVISNILFHYNGRIHNFSLELRPTSAELVIEKNACLSRWLSLLSRNSLKKLTLINWSEDLSTLVVMPSYIFHCTELIKLMLDGCILNSPPVEFRGFLHLTSLDLFSVIFNLGIDMRCSLVAKCPCLVFLRLEHCVDMHALDINAPCLETLVIYGEFDSLHLKNTSRLRDVLLYSTKSEMNATETVVATIDSLAGSNELHCLTINGNVCKFWAAGGVNKPLPIAFNHLNSLCLQDLMLNDSDVFRFTLGMLRSCPFIEYLELSIMPGSDDVVHKYEYSIDSFKKKYEYSIDSYKLAMLHWVKITGMMGKHAELKLVEYVLAISVVLENFCFKFATLDTDSELKVLRQLIRFPRASTKAQLVCL